MKKMVFLTIMLMAVLLIPGNVFAEWKIDLESNFFKSSLELQEDLDPGEEIGDITLKGWKKYLKASYIMDINENNDLSIYGIGGIGKVKTNAIPLSYMGYEFADVQVKGDLGYLLGLGADHTYWFNEKNKKFSLNSNVEISWFWSDCKTTFSMRDGSYSEESEGDLRQVPYKISLLPGYNFTESLKVSAGARYTKANTQIDNDDEDETELKGNSPWQAVLRADLAPDESSWSGALEFAKGKNSHLIMGRIGYRF